MATLLDTLIPYVAVDVVGVFTQDFTQVFPQARAIKAVVKEEAKVMEHPVETGAVITDHRVILPVEIELSMLIRSIDVQDVYRVIKQLYSNATLLVVQTRSGVYQNQLIAGLPHEETVDQYGALNVALKLKEVQFAIAQFTKTPKKPTNTSNVDRGIIEPKTPTPSEEKTTALFDLIFKR